MYKFQEKLIEIRNEKLQMKHEIVNYKKENEKLIAPLKIARQHIEELQQKLSQYERDQRRIEVQ